MKKVFLVIVVLSVGFLAYKEFDTLQNSSSNSTNEVLNTNGNDIAHSTLGDIDLYYSDKDEIYIAKIPKDNELKLSYHPDDPDSILETAKKENFVIAINASYFLEDYSHAGLLIYNKEQQSLFAPQDSQLTHVVVIGDDIEYIDNKSFVIDNYLQDNLVAFQTGPLVLDNGEIQTNFISSSLNGKSKHKRSLFGDSDTHYYFVATRRSYTLLELIDNINSYDLLDNSTTLINLDGGSSTSMYVEGNDTFTFNEERILPLFLGI